MHTVISCPACGENCSEVVASLDAQRAARFAEFDRLKYGGLLSKWTDSVPPVVSRCRVCGHCWYQHQPEPEQLGHMYAVGRPLEDGASITRDPTTYMRKEMRRLRKLVGASSYPLTMLDYGSGLGRWARAAVQEGFRVTAFEPSVERGAESDTPFRLVHSIDELDGETFAVIQIEQVLEHLPDPFATLSALRKHCNPETVIRITVPNVLRDPDGAQVWETWPFNGKSPHLLAPFEHLHSFTPTSLDRILKRSGYKNINIGKEMRYSVSNRFRQLAGRLVPSLNSTCRYVNIVF